MNMSELQALEPTEKELLHVIWLTQQRTYEVLLALLAGQNPEAFKQIVEQHKKFDLDESLFPFKTS